MFEHPYLSQQVTEFETMQMERMAERRRFIAEHPEQIVMRPDGPLRRMLRAIVSRRRAADRTATRPVAVCEAAPAR